MDDNTPPDRDPIEIESDPGTPYEVPEGHRSGFVALTGRPNVGKSTLMNALMEQKIAAVSPKPQTTRVRQLGIITRPDYQMVFVDTPGIVRKARHKLDEYMLSAASDTLHDSDVVLWLVDTTELPGAGDREIAAVLSQLPPDRKVILGLNKIDQVSPGDALMHTEAYRQLLPTAQWMHLSALQGDGVPQVLEALVDGLPEGPRYYPADQVTDVYIRNIAAELIREQLMIQLQEEIPYGTAVVVREYKERDDGTIYINADIFVERSNHKGIVIGKGGQQLRNIGTASRKEIEELVGSKVFLDLWVKVQPDWRRDERLLKQFGYDYSSE